MIRTRRAFSIIELLVVVAIIAVLIGILVPIVSSSQMRAGVAGCTANAGQIATAMAAYMRDNRNYFPAESGDSSQSILMKTSSSIGFRARYMNNSTDGFECPLDNGDSVASVDKVFSATTPASSYIYLNHADDSNVGYYYAYSDILAVERRRGTEFSVPEKKVVVLDLPILNNRPATDGRNQWHNKVNPLKGGVGYMDCHAGEVARKTTGSNPAAAITGGSIPTTISSLRTQTFY